MNVTILLTRVYYIYKETMKEDNDNLEDRIIADPKILAGKPVVKGTRIPVYVILEAIEAGKTVEEIPETYPDLDEKDVKAAIRYATEIVEREEVRKREAVT